jgi:hypothetical protein
VGRSDQPERISDGTAAPAAAIHERRSRRLTSRDLLCSSKIYESRYNDMKDGYCENCLNPDECYLSGRWWPVVDYVPDAGKLCAEMDDAAATATPMEDRWDYDHGPDHMREVIEDSQHNS